MVTQKEYLKDPCGALSVPYWKALRFPLPDGMKILHEKDYLPEKERDYTDEPYFRLCHSLAWIEKEHLPDGFCLETALLPRDAEDIAHTINGAYPHIRQTPEQVLCWAEHPVFDPALWVVIRRRGDGMAVASGVGELDAQMREGVLEWIQVLPPYRGMGLGAAVVNRLLRRIKGKADFATVSGQVNNLTNPQGLYRRCGFIGGDVWHVLTKRP